MRIREIVPSDVCKLWSHHSKIHNISNIDELLTWRNNNAASVYTVIKRVQTTDRRYTYIN